MCSALKFGVHDSFYSFRVSGLCSGKEKGRLTFVTGLQIVFLELLVTDDGREQKKRGKRSPSGDVRSDESYGR